LQWEKKTVAAGLHDVGGTYTWAGCCGGDCGSLANYCQPNAEAAATCAAQVDSGAQGCSTCTTGTCVVDPFGAGAVTTVWDWIDQVNAEGFAGHSDWRLPSELGDNTGLPGDPRELETILLPPSVCGSNPPCIDSIFGPTTPSLYWSSSTFIFSAVNARVAGFNNGEVGSFGKTNDISVRAVRPGP